MEGGGHFTFQCPCTVLSLPLQGHTDPVPLSEMTTSSTPFYNSMISSYTTPSTCKHLFVNSFSNKEITTYRLPKPSVNIVLHEDPKENDQEDDQDDPGEDDQESDQEDDEKEREDCHEYKNGTDFKQL